MITRKK